jgi:hypothetical protein
VERFPTPLAVLGIWSVNRHRIGDGARSEQNGVVQTDGSTPSDWERRYEQSLHEPAALVDTDEDRELGWRVLFVWLFVGLAPAVLVAFAGDHRSVLSRVGGAICVGLIGAIVAFRIEYSDD